MSGLARTCVSAMNSYRGLGLWRLKIETKLRHLCLSTHENGKRNCVIWFVTPGTQHMIAHLWLWRLKINIRLRHLGLWRLKIKAKLRHLVCNSWKWKAKLRHLCLWRLEIKIPMLAHLWLRRLKMETKLRNSNWLCINCNEIDSFWFTTTKLE